MDWTSFLWGAAIGFPAGWFLSARFHAIRIVRKYVKGVHDPTKTFSLE